MTPGRIAGLAALIGLTAGCIGLRGPADLQRELSRESGVALDREFGITVHRGGMWLVRLGLRMAQAEEATPLSIRGLRKIQVGVYEVNGLRSGVATRSSIDERLFPDWEPIVRIHDDDEDVLVLVQYEMERMRRMLVVVAGEEEWVLVRLTGRLDHLVEQALQAAFSGADRPDLYERSREQRGLSPSRTG